MTKSTYPVNWGAFPESKIHWFLLNVNLKASDAGQPDTPGLTWEAGFRPCKAEAPAPVQLFIPRALIMCRSRTKHYGHCCDCPHSRSLQLRTTVLKVTRTLTSPGELSKIPIPESHPQNLGFYQTGV